MADEGGASAALMEIDDDLERHRLHRALLGRERRQKRIAIGIAIAAASLALGAGAWFVGLRFAARSRRLSWSDIVGFGARLNWG
jgi:hypothetical protein